MSLGCCQLCVENIVTNSLPETTNFNIHHLHCCRASLRVTQASEVKRRRAEVRCVYMQSEIVHERTLVLIIFHKRHVYTSYIDTQIVYEGMLIVRFRPQIVYYVYIHITPEYWCLCARFHLPSQRCCRQPMMPLMRAPHAGCRLVVEKSAKPMASMRVPKPGLHV